MRVICINPIFWLLAFVENKPLKIKTFLVKISVSKINIYVYLFLSLQQQHHNHSNREHDFADTDLADYSNLVMTLRKSISSSTSDISSLTSVPED